VTAGLIIPSWSRSFGDDGVDERMEWIVSEVDTMTVSTQTRLHNRKEVAFNFHL
jgi:hypothetical protein